MMVNRRRAFLFALPLLLLALYPFASELFGRVGFAYPHGVAVRYLVVPVCGLAIALFLSNYTVAFRNWLSGQKAIRWVISIALIYTLLLVALKYLKFSAFNFEFFDAGIYDNKLWRIASAGWSDKVQAALFEGHFQPITLFYTLLYEIAETPFLPYLAETVALASGAVPLFLIARRVLVDDFLAALVSSAYLFYPALHFNDILGFHPDHVHLVALLWAFYFAQIEKHWAMAGALLLACSGSEQWIPGVAFFGLYLAFGQKKWLLGGAVFVSAISLFIFLLWYLMPHFNSLSSGQAVFVAQGSSYSNLASGNFVALAKGLLSPYKIFFLFFLLGPLLFLPAIAVPVFLVALPDLAKTLLSEEALHHAVEGHYTLGMIAVFFVAYVHALGTLRGKWGQAFTDRIGVIVLVLTVSMAVAHSPLPISMDFWTKWGALPGFHYSNYLPNARTAALKEAEALIGTDANQTVELTNSAYTPLIVHRHNIKLFPSPTWRKADFIIIDSGRTQHTGAVAAEDQYNKQYDTNYRQLRRNPEFTLIYRKADIEVYRKDMIAFR